MFHAGGRVMGACKQAMRVWCSFAAAHPHPAKQRALCRAAAHPGFPIELVQVVADAALCRVGVEAPRLVARDVGMPGNRHPLRHRGNAGLHGRRLRTQSAHGAQEGGGPQRAACHRSRALSAAGDRRGGCAAQGRALGHAH